MTCRFSVRKTRFLAKGLRFSYVGILVPLKMASFHAGPSLWKSGSADYAAERRVDEGYSMSRAKVLEVLPAATIERRRTNGHEIYYLVRKGPDEFGYIGSGDKPGEAWRVAWQRILPTLREAVAPKAAAE